MSDRSSAEIFGVMFELLAKNPTEENKKMAKKMWSYTFAYDFNFCQMGVEEALFALGLAKKGIDPESPDDGEVILYSNLKGTDFER